MRYEIHYTRDEARALLPQVRRWLKQLIDLRAGLQKNDKRLSRAMTPGRDMGGDLVNAWARTMGAMRSLLLEFTRRDIQIKDLDRGLVDFPAVIDGKEVFLCWESGEDDIGFWHDLDAGYAGREKLE